MKSFFLSQKTVETQALNFLKKYHASGEIPVPIDEIIEFGLKIDIVPTPALMEMTSVDAVTSCDLKQINIDKNQFERKPTRARFTLAHELGHIVLHQDFITSPSFKDEVAWKKFALDSMHEDPRETQANLFASFVLIPTASLKSEFESATIRFQSRKKTLEQMPAAAMAKKLALKFNVSEDAMKIRLKSWLQTTNR